MTVYLIQHFSAIARELLERYRDDGRIMTISGNNFQFGHRRTGYSYYFSRYVHIWGWATWRRVWAKYYDYNMKLWPEVRNFRWLIDIFGSIKAEHDWQHSIRLTGGSHTWKYWESVFEHVYAGHIDTWDYQLFFSSLLQNGLNILPAANLVSNFGFGPGASHTKIVSKFANISSVSMEFPLKHPPYVIRDA